jgi:hypothetical protein
MADEDQYIGDAPDDGYEGVDDVDIGGVGEVDEEGAAKEGDESSVVRCGCWTSTGSSNTICISAYGCLHQDAQWTM